MIADSGPATGPRIRVLVLAASPARRRDLTAALGAAGHVAVVNGPDVILCDLNGEIDVPTEAEAPVILLTDRGLPGEQAAGVLPRGVLPAQLDAAVRAVASGLSVRVAGGLAADGFRPAGDDAPLLTPREAEILTLVSQGLSNKRVARALGISVHTVKFHLEALFAKLDATSRAEAVAKGLRGGVIEL
jgi:DNA-binding NarL/FixJ family response regulator